MSIIEIIILLLVIVGIVGAGWIIFAALFMIYGWIETRRVRRKIDDKIKKEVTDTRLIKNERREEYGRNNGITEPVKDSESGNQSIPRDEQVGGRIDLQIQQTSNTPRAKPDTKINWADFS